ncbi:MAG: hypothetical protein ACT4PL_09300, partial [Phycisphaerales bacterium]
VESSDASLVALGASAWRWQVRGEVMLQRAAARSMECFARALAEPGADWFDRVMIAQMFLTHGRPGAALEFAQQAIALESGHPAGWMTLAVAQEQCGFVGSALESAARVLELAPGHVQATAMNERLARGGGVAGLLRRLTGWARG